MLLRHTCATPRPVGRNKRQHIAPPHLAVETLPAFSPEDGRKRLRLLRPTVLVGWAKARSAVPTSAAARSLCPPCRPPNERNEPTCCASARPRPGLRPAPFRCPCS